MAAIAENFFNKDRLYELKEDALVEKDPVFILTLDSIFFILLKSIHLLVEDNLRDENQLTTLLRAHEHIAKYMRIIKSKGMLSKAWRLSNLAHVKLNLKKLSSEVSVEFRRLNFKLIHFYLNLLKVK
jgi:hypothetical protein